MESRHREKRFLTDKDLEEIIQNLSESEDDFDDDDSIADYSSDESEPNTTFFTIDDIEEDLENQDNNLKVLVSSFSSNNDEIARASLGKTAKNNYKGISKSY